MGEKRIHIKIKGFVQGVFFRMHTQEAASRLGLTGWVKNATDGSVEITAEGDEGQLKKLEEWCYKGPPSSKVEGVKAEYSDFLGKFDSFRIRYY